MRRLFAAVKINPDDAFLGKLQGLQRSLQKERIKWVDPEHIHITLKFFGETAEDLIPGICSALECSGHGLGPFDLLIAGTGIFGSRYDPRVIWFGIQDGGKLGELQMRLQEELKPLGFEPDRQNFVPHLTAGRIKGIRNKSHFQKVIASAGESNIQQTEIRNYHLFESKLFSHGPEYSIIRTFDLQ